MSAVHRSHDLLIEDTGSSRLALALLVSVLLHLSLVAAVKVHAPTAGAPQVLRASLVSVSLPEPLRVSPPTQSEAPSELKSAAAAHEAAQAAPIEQHALSGITGADRPLADRVNDSGEYYYTTREVDVRATPVRMETTLASEKPMLLGRMVRVKLRLFISERGTVDRFEILEAEGLTSTVSLDDVAEIRFYPAEKSGRPVKSQKVVELTFAP